MAREMSPGVKGRERADKRDNVKYDSCLCVLRGIRHAYFKVDDGSLLNNGAIDMT
jgi:hypothetical protein